MQTRLAEQEVNISNLKQTLLRVTLAKQSLESEKKELLRKVEEIEGDGKELRRLGADKNVYQEELRVARDAISNLRSSFSESDPGQHVLDTLEQCISVIVERMVAGAIGTGNGNNIEVEQMNSGQSKIRFYFVLNKNY